MDYYAVEIAGDRIITFDGDDLHEPLAAFLKYCDSERKVSLTYVGEQWEEE